MRILAVLLTAFLSAAAAGEAERFWQRKPYTEWSALEARVLLSNSPWSRPVEEKFRRPQVISNFPFPVPTPGSPPVPGRGPGPYPPVGAPQPYPNPDEPRQFRYVVSWYSARPIRLALARLAELNGSASPEQIKAFIEEPQQHYIVALSGGDVDFFLKTPPDKIVKYAYLKSKSSGGRVYAVAYVPPRPEKDEPALFFFPRQANGRPIVGEKDKEVTFGVEGAERRIRVEFELGDMVYEGKLAL